MIDTNKNIEDFKKRYEYFKERIAEVVYPETEYESITMADFERYQELTHPEILKMIRTDLLDQKYNHSLRVVDMITSLNQIMNNNEFISQLSIIAGLLHDYGRFIQAVYHNSYYGAEKFYKEHGFNGHGEVGAYLLFYLNDINYFHIEKKYYPLLDNAIKYHQINRLEGNLNLKLQSMHTELTSSNIWELTSCMIQMVKDADMYDILYQRINGEYPLFTQYFNFHVNNMSIDEISGLTGVDVDEIMYINKLLKKDVSHLKLIRLPFEKIEPSLLEVPQQIKEKFFNKVYINNPSEWNLYKMQIDQSYNYNSIIAMWWTIGQFLGNMNFTSSLQLLKEQQILEKIYSLYPEKYRYLVKDMFDFAQVELIEKRIDNKGVYAKSL